MAADGRVEISVNLDNKEAEKKLSDLRRSIERTAKSIESTGGKKAAITEQLEQARQEAAATAKEIEELNAQKIENEATLSGRTGDVSLEEFEARKQAQAETTYQLKEQEKLQASQNSNIAKLEEKERALTAQIEQQTASLEKQKSEAGEVERVIASQASSAMPQLAASAEAVSKSMRKGFKSILKWGFGIRSAFILMRLLRSAVIEGVKAFAQQDEETRNNINGLKASLQTLKVSWGAAFAPILNAVAPILKTLISWLTAAANAIQRFFAILGGKGSYKKAIQNNENLANSYGGAGGAAEKAEKQILGFDEINKLNAESSGGGGGGGADPIETIEEAIDTQSLAARLAFAVRDVLFDWDDLTSEQIVEKAIAGLTMLGGAIIGGTIGGVPGIIIGALAGLAFGVWLDASTFNFDGQIDHEEIAKLVNMALIAASGGVIGFALGGPLGATIGVLAGLAFSILLNQSIFNSDGQLSRDELFRVIALAIGAIGGGIFGFMLGGPAGAAIGCLLGLIISFGLIQIDKEGAISKSISNFFGKIKDWFGSRIEEWKSVLPDNGSAVAFAFIAGIIQGIWDANVKLFSEIGKWGKGVLEKARNSLPKTSFAAIGKSIIDGIQQGIQDKWTSFENWFHGILDGLKQWWGNFSLGAFHLVLPHISYSLVTVPILGTIPDPRTMSIEWYAKGGIVDGATLIGAGEDGKEAIVPLERNTEWINMVARGLVDNITSNNRLADYVSNLPLPSVAQGQIVPPRALSNGGSMFTDGDIQRLVSGIAAAFTQDSGEQVTKLYLDGKQIAEAVTRHQRRVERGYA